MNAHSPEWDAKAPGWIVTRSANVEARRPGPCILAPILAGLGASLREIAAALPVGDANGMLLDEIGQAGMVAQNLIAGVLANDPFRSGGRLLGDLQQRGVRAVANWPSLGPISGELADALTHSGFTFDAEMAFLGRAREAGFATAAFVCGRDQAERAIALRADMIVVVPPLSQAAQDHRRAAAREAASVFSALAARGGAAELRLYLPARLIAAFDDVPVSPAEQIRFAAEAG